MEATNKTKVLYLIDRVPEKLWTEVSDIVQAAVIKIIPKKRKCKKATLLSEETLHIAQKRKVKGKRENERYKHMYAEFQRIARRNKKAFPTNQCKEIEESNRMGKTRDLFKKIRDTKGIFQANMGTIKDSIFMEITEA